MRRLLPITLILAGCASGARPGGTSPSPAAPPTLPPIPLVLGPLQPKVVYPEENQLLQSRDSNFIFGSVGNGHATLTINGTRVPVQPNGSFIAFLPLPPDSQPRYDLVAALGSDTARATRVVRLLPPRPQLLPTGPLVVDSASVTPSGRYALRDDELVRVSVRAPANATVFWHGQGDTTVALVNDAAPFTMAAGGAAAPGAPASGATSPTTAPAAPPLAGDAEQWATLLPAARLRAKSEIVVARVADTVRLALPAILPAPTTPTWGMLGADSSAVSDTDRVIIGRPEPSGTYKWLLMPRTVLPITGAAGDYVRVRLDDALEIWVGARDIRPLPAGWAPERRIAGNARVEPAAGWVDLVIPMSSRPAYLVDEGDHELALTLYGVTANTDIIHFADNDSLVRWVRWTQELPGRARYVVHLASQPYGYLVFWQDGNLVLRVRRPPVVNPARPLAGRVITVDPGHPPIGATGPTGLYEADAVLAVGLRVRQMLEARGATVIMTRTEKGPVALGDRPIIARRANADALVSIHLNALPDGINPFNANGTGAYYFHPQSAALARALQNGMVRNMGLRNLGVNYDNLALARPTWMPAVLCEGAFIMMPDQEAALRTPQFQAEYARGIVDGLESWFRSLAAR
ncbi:MAG TPA: N-acetylmuramoyl-L-alanine amidase [Gemmatimonadaceae bacterium]|nr:N-acetylmuramoyl-L-alanine amidase [Gemmatimonadaceae bacterium]